MLELVARPVRLCPSGWGKSFAVLELSPLPPLLRAAFRLRTGRARGRPLGGDDVIADGVAHNVGDRARADLAHDGGAVGLDGLDADAEPQRDVLAPAALSEELDHLALARREGAVGRVLTG